ncbi:TRM30 [Arabidopsis thaliana]|uniref:TRM30 n=1 Tax=Arabidopsis thaliana TaxID=3702 RepID=A0A178UM93_ARATH|nr:TRM30 [Arabidopsis thaliana]
MLVWWQTTFQDLTSGGIEASNELVPYGKGRSMEKLDLSKALAFALENAGKATRVDPSGSASIISFLHEVGKRSLGERRSSQIMVQQQQPSSSSPMIHVHIKEISKGAQKLNQIIKACSNGLSFRKGRYSIQCGEQLMEGAIELEQSLRLLVDIQQASEYTSHKQRKNRIKLLEENDDDDDEEEDAGNKNYQKIKQVAKADIEMRLLALNYQKDKNNKNRKQTSYCEDTEQRSTKPQKGRIPSVVAKLMGLGEFPQDEKETNIKHDGENFTRRRVMQASENLVERKAQRKSTTLDLVIHKQTQTVNEINYKAKSQQKDRETDDSKSRKRSKVSYKKDGETTTTNPAPTENKHKVVARSKQKPLHKLSNKKEKLQRERHRENGVTTNHSQKPLSSEDLQMKVGVIDKAKAMKKSFSHVEVAQKGKEGEVHKAKIREKKNQDIYIPNEALCKVMKRPEIKKEDGKHDLLLKSYNDSNEKKAEVDTCIKSSQVSGVEHKKEIKDDSILLIAAERVPCQAPSENHHGRMFTNGMDQQAPIPKSDGNLDILSKTVYKETKGEIEAGLPLLEKRQERRKRETTETLPENEINLKKIFVKSQLFLDTAKAHFKLNIPQNVFHDATDGSNYYQEDNNLILECAFELMKRKRRFQELSVHPFVKVPVSSSRVNSLDHLIRQISKELEKLRAYGRDCHIGSHVEDYVLERDVHYKDPNLNSMWDMGWNDSMLAFIEKDDVMRDIEREVFSGLLEEITRDLICI